MSARSLACRLVVVCGCVSAVFILAKREVSPAPKATTNVMAQQPLSFEVNQGQADPQVKFVSRGPNHALLLTADQAVLQIVAPRSSAAVRMRLGDGRTTEIEPLDPQPGQVNYLFGNDPAKWHLDVPHYARVKYREAYPGVDLVFYGNQRQLEYDLVVSPGTAPSAIALQFDGATSLTVSDAGSLVLETDGGRIEQARPVVYQDVNGERKLVDGRYVVNGERVGFEVGAYDTAHPLVIDPSVAFFSYHGGGGDEITSITGDSTGNIYVAGFTRATNFPTAGPLQGTAGGGVDGFITKFGPGGSPMIFSTYLGGSGDDFIRGMAVGGRAGNVVVTGDTASANFPTFKPLQRASGGGVDGFVARLNAAGNGFDFSTFLGGAGDDRANGIALDANGNIYLVGTTASQNFPSASANFPSADAPPLTKYAGGSSDIFITQINGTDLSTFVSKLLGGRGADQGNAITVSFDGIVSFTGGSDSPDLTIVPGAPQSGILGLGGTDVIVGSWNITDLRSSIPVFPIGGSGDDEGISIVGLFPYIGVTGRTSSPNFPVASRDSAQLFQPAQTVIGGGSDAFYTIVNLRGATPTVVNSTFLGGNGNDVGTGIAADMFGNVMITGRTNSTDLKLFNSIQSAIAGGASDVFIAGLPPAGPITMQSPFGGPGEDYGDAAFYDMATNSWWVAGMSVNPQGQPKGFFMNIRGVPFPPPGPGPLRK